MATTRFCTECNNLLRAQVTSKHISMVCTSCSKKHEFLDDDKVLFGETTELSIMQKLGIMLEYMEKPYWAPREYKKCKNCDSEILTYMITPDVRKIYKCPECKTIYNVGMSEIMQ